MATVVRCDSRSDDARDVALFRHRQSQECKLEGTTRFSLTSSLLASLPLSPIGSTSMCTIIAYHLAVIVRLLALPRRRALLRALSTFGLSLETQTDVRANTSLFLAFN